MGIISKTGHISQKSMLNHNGSPGDTIKILYTPNGGNEITVLEYIVDPGKLTNFTFEMKEFTST